MKYIVKSLMLVLLISFAACETSFDEVNIDPNNSPTARDANVLTAAQGFLGYIVDVDLNSRSFLWAQYYTWGIGVSIGNAERFVAEPNDYDAYWSRAYASALADLKFLTKSDDPAYSGVAKVLEAYIYQGLVDHFGNIPFSQAVSGEISEGAILTPAYDDAAAIYGDLVVKLDDAIKELNAGGSTTMGADDLIYNGDLGNWIKFANSLKLRILMRTSEVAPKGSEIQALISSGDFINSVSDMPAVPFAGNSGDQNPMFARFSFGVGDFYFASNATLNVFENLGDPRADAFYSRATTGAFMGQFRGIDQGTIDDEPFTAPPTDYSGSSPLVYGASMPVILMSEWEVKFLRAEAAARYGTSDNDESMLVSAIEANFDYFGIADGTTYANGLGYGAASSLDAKLDIIGVQKWISLNGTQEDEGWIEARRFDRPASRLFTNGIFQNPPLSVLPAGTFPSAWLYPATERSFNPNAPAQRTLTDKIFWDN